MAVAVMGVTGGMSKAHAAEAKTPPDLDWSFEGPFGTYDRAAMQRGFKVYRQVCATCHALKHLHYRNLSDLGYTEAQIKAIAAKDTVRDGPNDQGKMFERPAKPSDKIARPYKNKAQAKYANNGAYPPDQSLIVDARAGGADYVYGILTGYTDPPESKELRAGQYWNKYMPGHIIAMPPPLQDGIVKYEDGSPETVEQYARDVTHFLTWASEPKMEARKQMGIKVILFLIVFAAVMYGVKKKLWARLEH
jgi:ubiquinol-cytochrome c reductase cytochrome c1 subunit